MKTLRQALLTLCLLLLLVTNIQANEGFLFEDEATYLNELGIFDGKSTTFFDPALGDDLTRQEGMKLLADLFSWNVDEKGISGFDDVSPWAEPYVKVAVDHGVTNGIGGGKFGGSNKVTFAQFYTWILRELGEEDIYNQSASKWLENIEALATPKALFFNEIDNGALSMNRDYAVGIMNKALPLKSENESKSFIDKINERKDEESIAGISITSIQPQEGFIKNGITQVKVDDSKTLLLEIKNYLGTPTSIDLALCGKNLCTLITVEIAKTSQAEHYLVTLPEALEVGVAYYFSSVIMTDTEVITITDISNSGFLVVNNQTDVNGTLTNIESRTELDNYIAYSNQELVIDFYANWCGPCVALAPIYKEASVILDGKINMLKVNIDVVNTNGYEVYSIPNQQFYSGGQKVGDYVGYLQRTGDEYADLVLSYFLK